jgi:hypothetical protein
MTSEVTEVVAIARSRSRPMVGVSPALVALVVIALIGVAVLALMALNVLSADESLPLWSTVPGAPDLARTIA